MEAVLVTGGAGYIGSHTCKALFHEGFLPVTYDNLSAGHAYAVKWGPLIQADLHDVNALDKAFELFRPKAVLHFAAHALVVESILQPGKYYQNNVGGSLALFEAMRRHGVPFLVFSSTCAIYGHPHRLPIEETHPQLPISPYGRSKQMVEQILADFEKAHGLSSVILRYFNAAGADLETQIGENHTPETHILPSLILTALGKREECVVYGNDFPTPDGSAVRDYIHVEDLANAHVRALKWLLEHKTSAAINLGTGVGYSVLELIGAVQRLSGMPLKIRFEQRRPGEPACLTADNRKAKELLSWIPRVSDLSTLIESAWKWHQLLSEKEPLIRSTLEKTIKAC